MYIYTHITYIHIYYVYIYAAANYIINILIYNIYIYLYIHFFICFCRTTTGGMYLRGLGEYIVYIYVCVYTYLQG